MESYTLPTSTCSRPCNKDTWEPDPSFYDGSLSVVPVVQRIATDLLIDNTRRIVTKCNVQRSDIMSTVVAAKPRAPMPWL
jgi:hypothetical protein